MRRYVFLVTIVLGVVGSGIVLASLSHEEGRIGPDTGIQPSGRKLNPVGELTRLGNLPAGGALTANGRFAWSLSAGRGKNDIRIIRVRSSCGKADSPRRCRRRQPVGEVVQKILMPGVSGGIAMAADGTTAYVSGTPESQHDGYQVPDDVPGQEGDVVHVFDYDKRTGEATRDGVIEVPPPPGTPPPQNFPPINTEPLSWPRDLAISPDGTTLLAALNLADSAAVIDTQTREVEYVATGRYPYGAAITADGQRGLISNEADGTVSVIDLAGASELEEITVGPHLSHPEGIAVDPRKPRAYVAVTHQDLIAVINTESLQVERMLSVERPQGIGTAPTHLSVTVDGCRLLSSDSGEDAVAIFSLSSRPRCGRARGTRAAAVAERVLQHEAREGVELAESEAEERAELLGEEAEEKAEEAVAEQPAVKRGEKFQLLGRVPVASYPVAAMATPQPAKRRKLVWLTAKGLGVGPNDPEPGQEIPPDPGSATGGAPASYRFEYLPSHVFGMSGITRFPGERRLRRLTPRASKQILPVNRQKRPEGNPIYPGGPIEHVFYIVRENRTYDQILGDDPRGDGDPKLTLFCGNDPPPSCAGMEGVTPNAHALAERFPLLDHVYANSEASIDGHFWTSAAAVSDYVVKNWHQNYGNRKRPYDFGVYAVTWPSQLFLFDQAEEEGISWFNYGEAVAGTVPLNDLDRTPAENAQVAAKFAKSDLGPLNPGPQLPPPSPCFSNDASSGGTNVITQQEVFDSSRPAGADPLTTESRFQCFSQRFQQQLVSDSVPTFNYITLPNDHTAGTTPGRRTPRAMIAENDLALGEVVEEISNSPIWEKSLILVIEDDSQDGADHVDAHRIPAFAISPYARRGAVVHTRYDFLSFIRTLERVIGMKPLNLFDATAVPMYDAFDSDLSDNAEPYEAIIPEVDLLERNTAASPNAKQSSRLPLDFTDRTPQGVLDQILWQYVHGEGSTPPPPGPNASGLDEQRWRQEGLVTPEEARRELLEQAKQWPGYERRGR
ncbi:MAG: alkaline phosphatase family protein [Solirubrobacterales bacterium]